MSATTYTFPPTQDAPGLARRAVRDLAFGEPPASDLMLAVTELVTNSVRHADLASDASLEMRVFRQVDHVRIEVCDPGVGFRIAPRASDDHGGRGLMIVDAVAQRWGIERDGHTCVWFEMALDAA